jgi:hypothetical protein
LTTELRGSRHQLQDPGKFKSLRKSPPPHTATECQSKSYSQYMSLCGHQLMEAGLGDLVAGGRLAYRWSCIRVQHPLTPLALKGTVSRDFLLLVFLMNQLPPSPEYCIRTVSNFFENSQVKVHHRYQRHRWQICHQCQRHRRQIFPPISLVLLIPVANLPPVSTIPAENLPPVSTTPVANCHRYQRCRRQICHRCQ